MINEFILVFSILCPISIGFIPSGQPQTDGGLFPLSLIHINDFHARFAETDLQTNTCKKDDQHCIGGYARIVTVVKRLIADRENPIYMNVGDNFAGTIWYSMDKWNVTSYFLNLLPADVMTLGNHEFDDSIEGIAPFLDAIKTPIVLANVDTTNEPTLQGKFQNSTVLNRGNRRIGIIGVLTRNTQKLPETGKLHFRDEIATVREEAKKLKNQGIEIILLLSHCGLEADYKIAKEAGDHIDVIIGGHSHSLLYSGANPPSTDIPEDDYPAIIVPANNRKVLIVQAAANAKYVGDLQVFFNDEGEVVQWKGQPIYLDTNVPEDEDIMRDIQLWGQKYANITENVIGYADELYDNYDCYASECPLGSFIADAYLHASQAHENENTSIAFVQAGGIRAPISPGTITYGDLKALLPFGDTVDSFDVSGQDIVDALEHSVGHIFSKELRVNTILQVSGVEVKFNITEPIGKRVVFVKVLCTKCSPKRYEPIDAIRLYRIVASNYVVEGGDGYTVFADNKRNHRVGEKDIDIVVNYLKSISKLETKKSGRITIVA